MARRQWSFWMPPQDHGFIRRWMGYVRSRLTPSGRVLCMAMLVGATFTIRTSVAVYLVPCFAFGILIAGALMSPWFRPRITAERLMPSPPTAGQILRYRVRVKNTGTRPVRGLTLVEGKVPFGLYMVAEKDGGVAEHDLLLPGEETVLTLALRCSRRGAFELSYLNAGSAFPSGLVRWPRRVGNARQLLVYPTFVTQHEFELPTAERYQPGGILVSSKVGGSTEFYGTRDYREGDRLRDIHWASLARSGRLIVKEYREEYFVRIGLLLDTQLPRRVSQDSFEHRISLAAGIADALARRDYVIDLFAAGEELHHFQAGRALARLDNVLELLACVESGRTVDWGLVETRMLPHARQLSSMVLLLWDWDEPRARLVQLLRQAGAGVRAIVVRDAPPSLPPDPDVLVVPARGGQELVR